MSVAGLQLSAASAPARASTSSEGAAPRSASEIAGIPVRDQKKADPRANPPAPAWPAPSNRARQDGRVALERALAAMPPSSRERMVSSLRTFLAAVGQEVPDGQDLVLQTLEKVFEEAPKGACWLLRAVLEARVPSADAVDEFERLLSGDGVLGAIAILLGTSVFASDAGSGVVEVLAGRVVVDVHHTSATDLSTGIQRVARETTRRWADRHDVVLVGWDDGYRGMRRLDASERDRLFRGAEASAGGTLGAGEPVLIPWRCTHVLPEIPGDEHRPRLYKALALHSAASTAMIGFDCVPLTTAETTADAMPAVFCSFLTAAAHFDKVAAISNASATEFLGWKQMLGPSGLTGPEVRAVSLPVEVREPSTEALAEARHRIAIGNLPTVLVVGSHEPRKNHVAVVNAAERLWREGMSFSLTFIGGNSWKSEEFQSMVQNLRWHRPIAVLRALSDELLWAAYRLAYCTVFVSLHEGFGLPLAESLASGTPAVTSDRGSMAELSDEGGALVVDPRDDDAIANALRRLLRSRTYRDRLAAELEGRRWKTWEEYAAELWDFLVEKSPPVAGDG
jgi:glycosyltransferase involved in cell wall biosynthesis